MSLPSKFTFFLPDPPGERFGPEAAWSLANKTMRIDGVPYLVTGTKWLGLQGGIELTVEVVRHQQPDMQD